uniref:Uncharacterized protein n=1 Tax=Zea mays TaxID=4577 RepID=C4J2E6_MAIZE|nr:unknown [Zea mays]
MHAIVSCIRSSLYLKPYIL